MPTNRPTVLITGASRGIGAATAAVFAKAGYDVFVNYRSSPNLKGAQQTVTTCRAEGVQAWAVQADVTNEEDLKNLTATVAKTAGKLDVLINNAAKAGGLPFDELSKADIMKALENILVGPLLVTRAFVPHLMNEKGVVLNVASIYGLDQSGNPKRPLYSLAKAALINATQTLAKHYAPTIRFNAVAPGFTFTSHWENQPAQRQQAVIDSTLLKEFIAPEEIGQALLFLAQAKHINAATLVVDSGWSKKDNR